MSTPNGRALAVLCLAICGVGTLTAQDAVKTLERLNALLATSCTYTPALTLATDGTVAYKNSRGATGTFKLGDIGEITIDRTGVNPDVSDVQGHVLLRCKDDQPCLEWTPSAGVAKTTGKLLVFSITPGDPTGYEVLKLFKDLHASATRK